jgi:hypothetical protein
VSSERWLLSLLIVIHLVAISASSVPDPRDLNAARATAPAATDSIARFATPAWNALFAVLAPLEAQVYRFTAPLRALTRTYIEAGLRQKWDMFANPVTADQYVRVMHYVESSREPGRMRVFAELALPAQQEDQVRLVHKFRDKAILNSFETFAARVRDHPEAHDTSPMEPIAAYFGRRFRARYLAQDETVLRTELWFGAAPTPPIYKRVADSQLQARLAVLRRYWEVPVESLSSAVPSIPGVLQGESDIVWRLDYVDKR